MPSRLDVTPAWRLRNGRNGLLLAKHAYGIGEDHERLRRQPLSIEVRVSLPELLLQRDQISRNVHIGPLESQQQRTSSFKLPPRQHERNRQEHKRRGE